MIRILKAAYESGLLTFMAVVSEGVFLGYTLHAKGFSVAESFIFAVAWFSLRSHVMEIGDRVKAGKR